MLHYHASPGYASALTLSLGLFLAGQWVAKRTESYSVKYNKHPEDGEIH